MLLPFFYAIILMYFVETIRFFRYRSQPTVCNGGAGETLKAEM